MAAQRPELILYKFDACPYCQMVMAFAQSAGIELIYKDTREDPGAEEELVRIGGKSQVPCLLIDGEPMYESRDIINYLRRFEAGGA